MLTTTIGVSLFLSGLLSLHAKDSVLRQTDLAESKTQGHAAAFAVCRAFRKDALRLQRAVCRGSVSSQNGAV
jgi:hypothetical protein